MIFGKLFSIFSGKKTYFIGLVALGYGLYNHFFGLELSWAETIDYVFGGTALMTARAAIDKVKIGK